MIYGAYLIPLLLDMIGLDAKLVSISLNDMTDTTFQIMCQSRMFHAYGVTEHTLNETARELCTDALGVYINQIEIDIQHPKPSYYAYNF